MCVASARPKIRNQFSPCSHIGVSFITAVEGHYLIPNIKENPRNRKTTKRGRKRFFNEAIHALRMRVERTFAWEDKFKRLLLRFERIQQRHYGMKLMAYTLINLRAFCGV